MTVKGEWGVQCTTDNTYRVWGDVLTIYILNVLMSAKLNGGEFP